MSTQLWPWDYVKPTVWNSHNQTGYHHLKHKELHWCSTYKVCEGENPMARHTFPPQPTKPRTLCKCASHASENYTTAKPRAVSFPWVSVKRKTHGSDWVLRTSQFWVGTVNQSTMHETQPPARIGWEQHLGRPGPERRMLITVPPGYSTCRVSVSIWGPSITCKTQCSSPCSSRAPAGRVRVWEWECCCRNQPPPHQTPDAPRLKQQVQKGIKCPKAKRVLVSEWL